MTVASDEAPLRSVRVFGALLVAAGWFAYRSAARHALPPWAAVSLGGVVAALGVFALIAPAAARPVYRAWMAVGHALGRVTTPVVLTLVFVVVIVPLRLVLRALGRDPLEQRFDRSARSYWHERARKTASPDDFERLA